MDVDKLRRLDVPRTPKKRRSRDLPSRPRDASSRKKSPARRLRPISPRRSPPRAFEIFVDSPFRTQTPKKMTNQELFDVIQGKDPRARPSDYKSHGRWNRDDLVEDYRLHVRFGV